MTPHSPDILGAIERPLHGQLALCAIALAVLGVALGHADYGVAGAAGVLAAMGYYWMLGMQVRRQLLLARAPNVPMMIISLLGRQVICLAIPSACYFLLGPAWWASLVSLLVARHWVMLIALPPTDGAIAPAAGA